MQCAAGTLEKVLQGQEYLRWALLLILYILSTQAKNSKSELRQ
jgi:cytochrome c oxidase subunit IV